MGRKKESIRRKSDWFNNSKGFGFIQRDYSISENSMPHPQEEETSHLVSMPDEHSSMEQDEWCKENFSLSTTIYRSTSEKNLIHSLFVSKDHVTVIGKTGSNVHIKIQEIAERKKLITTFNENFGLEINSLRIKDIGAFLQTVSEVEPLLKKIETDIKQSIGIKFIYNYIAPSWVKSRCVGLPMVHWKSTDDTCTIKRFSIYLKSPEKIQITISPRDNTDVIEKIEGLPTIEGVDIKKVSSIHWSTPYVEIETTNRQNTKKIIQHIFEIEPSINAINDDYLAELFEQGSQKLAFCCGFFSDRNSLRTAYMNPLFKNAAVGMVLDFVGLGLSGPTRSSMG